MGATRLAERFPGTPVYMTAAAAQRYHKEAPQMIASEKKWRPATAPDSIAHITTNCPSLLPDVVPAQG